MIKSQIIVKHHKTLKPYELAQSLVYLKTTGKSYVPTLKVTQLFPRLVMMKNFRLN